MTVPEISVRNLQRRVPIHVATLQNFAVKAVQNCLQLQKEKQTDLRRVGEISVLLISDRRISQLHRQFLGQREPTDVLTFQHGEIFISVETARRYARVFANSLVRELEQQAISDRGKAEGTRDTLRTEIEEATRVREAAVAEFQSFAATGVLRIALPDLEVPDPAEPWPPTPTVILARAVNAALEDTDDADGPWERAQRRVTEEHKLLADAMARHGHSAGMTLPDGIIVVDVVFQGRSHDIPRLAEALREEAEQRARLLSAREREILENHLLNEVAGTLHELITAAETEVRGMNDELESRPTSTGMKLRLVWQQAREAPDGLDRVRHKLRQTVDAWSTDARATVGSFLQQRIATEHASNPAAGWAEALTVALDYRRWHEFVIQRYQDGQWRPATGPASGGERALAASVPLFAAASAHYKSASNPNAPRLIALDEAFAGVDDDSRAKCLGLLATFDMDVVMTSEREWGCYLQVPGLGICQLARHDGIDAVLVTPDARGPDFFDFDIATGRVRQSILDPNDDRQWFVEGAVDRRRASCACHALAHRPSSERVLL